MLLSAQCGGRPSTRRKARPASPRQLVAWRESGTIYTLGFVAQASDDSGPFRLSPRVASPEFPPLSSRVLPDIAARSRPGRGRVINTDHYLATRMGRDEEVLLTSLPEDYVTRRFNENAY